MNLSLSLIQSKRFVFILALAFWFFLNQNVVWADNHGYYPYYEQIPPISLQNGMTSPISSSMNMYPGEYRGGQSNSFSPGNQGFSGNDRYQNFGPLPSAPNRFIVKYKNSMESNSLVQGDPIGPIMNPEGKPAEIHQISLGDAGLHIVQVPTDSLDTVMTVFQNNPLVDYAEPDYQISVEPSSTGVQVITSSAGSTTKKPNDPEYPKLWGLHNTGQSPFNGTPSADIGAEKAWGITTGSSDIVVAVIDSGVDYTHQDLADNIWTNEKEIPENGIDDDGNGYIDDIHGWNFQGENNSPVDENGHGTHCAGIIGAVGDNNLGCTGVNWHVKIMPLKFMDSTGNGYISDAISAILYANKMGADVISCSWSGGENSQALQDAITASSAVVVCAAGNGGADDDTTAVYPATFSSPNLITVAASDSNDNLASFSNYGLKTVQIAAPGVEIVSTYPGNRYAYMSGTSMATPYAAGAAALLKAAKPSLTNNQIRDALISSVDQNSNLSGKISTGGRLDVYLALTGERGTSAGAEKIVTSTTPLPASLMNPSVTPTMSATIFLSQPSEPEQTTISVTRVSPSSPVSFPAYSYPDFVVH
ncbi:MAG: S8 family serine peptidase [Methanospirillum sp.]|uniref:S8 family peptidase n=1 Tax=Methanospirillum sp. TaxID=45200 RepID=UPI00236B7D0C|nr:S8 family peptidase [Methanospirillum sp.]MDD1729881.1 S8 family serine peptidase [Methanospirillum sp.]